MKIKKIMVLLMTLLIGVSFVNAEEKIDCTGKQSEIEAYAKGFAKTSVLVLYENNYDQSKGSDEAKMTDAISKVKASVDASSTVGQALASLGSSELLTIYGYYQKEIDGDFIRSLLDEHGSSDKVVDDTKSFNSVLEYARYFDSAFAVAAAELKNGKCDNSDQYYNENYSSLKSTLSNSMSDFCAYLRSSVGLTQFIKMALNIVSYAAMLLAIVLGILDFIKAIGSHDDAGLSKAFATFMKRIVAVILIFIANLIVVFVLNLVAIKGVDVDHAICDEIGIANGGVFGGLK